MLGLYLKLALLAVIHFATAQFPPTPHGRTVLRSKFHENVTISFKEPGICETTHGVKSYAGHVHLPPGFLDDGTPDAEAQDYPINTFFWFFEARHNAARAPLAIWLNGGPGGSSLMGLLEENGPCLIEADSRTARLNPWSWNNEVNMLYIDQPNQVGFSYDTPTPGALVPADENTDPFLRPQPFNFSEPDAELGKLANATFHPGMFASQDPRHTANTTRAAAHAVWHFAQTWFGEFPHYAPEDDRISLMTESYGGHYGPGFMQFFQEMNERIREGRDKEKGARELHLDTLGIVNGCIDVLMMTQSYIEFGHNNTYGIQIFNDTLYNALTQNYTRPGGCRDQLKACQDELRDKNIPFPRGGDLRRRSSTDETAPQICPNLQDECLDIGAGAYQASRAGGWYDIAHPSADPFPPPHMFGYLTQASVLAALGTPVNFTFASPAVAAQFDATRDMERGDFLGALAGLLDAGVKVHLLYGDRDYACNWLGGERSSLAIPWARAGEFAEAGYAPLMVPARYEYEHERHGRRGRHHGRDKDGGEDSDGQGKHHRGHHRKEQMLWAGMTRQVGNFSFSRVFQAGHEVPSYAPAAAHALFARAVFGRDMATGTARVTDGLRTEGPEDTWAVKNAVPERPAPRCYVLKPGTCLPEVWKRVREGTATVRDWFVVEENGKVEVVEEGVEVEVLGDGEL